MTYTKSLKYFSRAPVKNGVLCPSNIYAYTSSEFITTWKTHPHKRTHSHAGNKITSYFLHTNISVSKISKYLPQKSYLASQIKMSTDL